MNGEMDHTKAGTAARSAGSKAPSSGQAFSNVRAVAKYLQSQGRKISQSAVYNHVRAGKLKARRNGTFAVEDVDRYAALNLKRADGVGSGPALTPAEEKRQELELREREANTQLAEFKLAEKTRDLVTGPLQQALAARLIILRSDMENFIHSRSSALIAAVEGNQARAPELVALFLAAGESWLARYAKGREFVIDANGSVSPPFGDDDDEPPSAGAAAGAAAPPGGAP